MRSLTKLADAGLPIKADREKAWTDFAGWRVNYDRVLLVLCTLVMAPEAPWSSDRAPKFKMPPLFFQKEARLIKVKTSCGRIFCPRC